MKLPAPDLPPRSAPLAITGLGAVTSLGADIDALWEALAAGRDGIARATRFATPELAARFAALVAEPAWRDRLASPAREAGLDPCAELAIQAAREAIRHAGLHRAPAIPAHRLALVFGTSTGGISSRSAYEFAPPGELERRSRLLARSGCHVQTAAIAAALGLEGPRLTLSTACTSSANAVAHARELLEAGLCDVALAGGADVVAEEVIAGFHAMDAISPGPCAPFSEPVGMTVGEGAGFVVLESPDHARSRGAPALALIVGHGLSADAYHATAPDPTGAGVARALSSALADAGLAPGDMGYVNAHGTGTEANDAAEWSALLRVFGDHAASMPVSSTKSYFGHTLGAAGVLELIATLLSIRRDLVPPTLHFTAPRGGCPQDPVAQGTPRPHRCTHAVSSSSAFGGANAAIVVRAVRADGEHPDSELPAPSPALSGDDPIVFLGAGAVAAHGFEHLDEALRRGVPLWLPLDPPRGGLPLPPAAARVPPIPLERLARGADLRGMDALSRLLLAATALALASAGVRVRGALRERAGLFAGASRLPWDSAGAYWGSLRERGFARASAPAFARIVMNAPAGAVARALSLRGPTSLFAGGPGSALVAVLHAAHALSRGRGADLLVAGSAHELADGMLVDHATRHPRLSSTDWRLPFPVHGTFEERPIPGEHAACVVLSRASMAKASSLRPVARLSGAGLAGPRGLDRAIHQALAGASPDEVDAVYGCADGREASGAREVEALRAVFEGRLPEIPLFTPAPLLGTSDALDALTLAAALDALRVGSVHATPGSASGLNLSGAPRRPARTVLVLSADEAAGSVALLLRAAPGSPG